MNLAKCVCSGERRNWQSRLKTDFKTQDAVSVPVESENKSGFSLRLAPSASDQKNKKLPNSQVSRSDILPYICILLVACNFIYKSHAIVKIM